MATNSRIQSELDVLAAVERGEVVTQMDLRHRLGVSIGLINALLKRAIKKGYVKTRQVPFKRYSYYVTPKGFIEKSRLVATFLDHSLQFYRSARQEYAELISNARQAGMTRIILVGGGELAEIAILAAWGENVDLLAIVDPKANQSERNGLSVIRSVTEVEGVDAAIITDVRTPQRTYEQVCAELPRAHVLAPPLLRITPDRNQLLASSRQWERPS